MTATTITAKGQIVIPSRIRKHLKIKAGMRIVLREQGNKIIIEPVNESYFDQFAGIFKSERNLTSELIKERRADKKI